MTLVTSSEIGPPSVHSIQDIHNGLPVAATANPGRTETFNVPKSIYPKFLDKDGQVVEPQHAEYTVTIDKDFPDLRNIHYKDGSFIGKTTHGNRGDTFWPQMITKHQQDLDNARVSDITKSEYENQERQRQGKTGNI